MKVFDVLNGRAAGHGAAPAPDRSVLIVVTLMMTLVFAPVAGLHLAVSAAVPPDPGSARALPSNAAASVQTASDKAS